MLVIRSDATMIRVIVNVTHTVSVLNDVTADTIKTIKYSKHNTRTWNLNVPINEYPPNALAAIRYLRFRQ